MFLYRDPLGHEHLFSGDALFPGGVGKTSSPENFEILFHGIKTQVFEQLSDLTWIYPGHGDDTTLGAERPQLSDWERRGW
jgi:glyoxylase-like metal-dependent hydrolase (beta-lactamase superfamily II)